MVDLHFQMWYNNSVRKINKERAISIVGYRRVIKMAKMVGMNANYKEVAGVLATFENGSAFAREVLNKMVAAGSKRTFNSVNATLAAMAGKGFVTKAKAVYNDKILTKYTLTEAGRVELEKVDADAEAPAE